MTGALSRRAADEEAVADARALTEVLGRSVAQPAIPERLVTGDAAAIDRLDRTVLDRLRLVVEGLLNKQIAARLGITERTVMAHLTSAYQGIGVADRTQAALWVQRHDLDGS